ncbi:DNA-binding transcriptional LysR family regulator [Kitasatospora acidiphila]
MLDDQPVLDAEEVEGGEVGRTAGPGDGAVPDAAGGEPVVLGDHVRLQGLPVGHRAAADRSSEIPGRVLAGDLDVGIALFPEPMKGVRSAVVRSEPLALLCGKDHRLAGTDPVPVADLENESVLLFPRELAPGSYDRVVAACEQSGFQPRIQIFADPPPQAMVARLRANREIGLPPASFAYHTAAADRGYAACRLVRPEIRVEWSILWSARTRPAAVTRLLGSARRCAEEQGWLLSTPDDTWDDSRTSSPSP